MRILFFGGGGHSAYIYILYTLSYVLHYTTGIIVYTVPIKVNTSWSIDAQRGILCHACGSLLCAAVFSLMLTPRDIAGVVLAGACKYL